MPNIETDIKKTKCPVCNKKIKPLEELYCKCKCGLTFCNFHKTPDANDSSYTHKCLYDYLANYKKDIEISNPKIIADKVEKV